MNGFPRKEVFKMLRVNDSSFYRWRGERLKKKADDEMTMRRRFFAGVNGFVKRKEMLDTLGFFK